MGDEHQRLALWKQLQADIARLRRERPDADIQVRTNVQTAAEIAISTLGHLMLLTDGAGCWMGRAHGADRWLSVDQLKDGEVIVEWEKTAP